MLFLVSFIRRPFLWPCGRRQSFATKLALGAKFAKNTKLTKISAISASSAVIKITVLIRVNPCSSVVNFSTNNELRSINNDKLCETNPISEKPKMVVTAVYTMTNNNKQSTFNYSKQTQTKPTCSELACGELVEPVEGVEPMDYIYTVDETKKSV